MTRQRHERIPHSPSWVDCPVSTQVLATGGAAVRRLIRDECRRALEAVARENGDELRPWDRLRYFVDPVERYGLVDAMRADLPWGHVIRAVPV